MLRNGLWGGGWGGGGGVGGGGVGGGNYVLFEANSRALNSLGAKDKWGIGNVGGKKKGKIRKSC